MTVADCVNMRVLDFDVDDIRVCVEHCECTVEGLCVEDAYVDTVKGVEIKVSFSVPKNRKYKMTRNGTMRYLKSKY